MFNFKKGKILKVIKKGKDKSKVLVKTGDKVRSAINYNQFFPFLDKGDEVFINTTAQDLDLGSGGLDFVFFNNSQQKRKISSELGHIMKLRYTPMQFSVLSCEEEESPFHSCIKKTNSLNGTPVVIGILHSQLIPAILSLNRHGEGKLKIVYIMTDGGALPISFSKQVEKLKTYDLLTGTITIGQAFGGDLEAVNIYSGLLAAKAVFNADVIITTMGPGITGTNTSYGFSGIEQGQIANAVHSLQGLPIIIPRISFADKRIRHLGLSHHSQVILEKVTLCKTWVGLPVLEKAKEELIFEQIKKKNLDKKHIFLLRDATHLQCELDRFNLNLSTMGRQFEEDKEFFQASWSSATIAYEKLCFN